MVIPTLFRVPQVPHPAWPPPPAYATDWHLPVNLRGFKFAYPSESYFTLLWWWTYWYKTVRLSREWIGKEVVTKYTTKIASNGTFYTDSNGRRWMKRKPNHRSSWNLTVTEPVASNYYPITSSIAIRDSVYQATVVTDRSQGGTSIEDGTMELMVCLRYGAIRAVP